MCLKFPHVFFVVIQTNIHVNTPTCCRKYPVILPHELLPWLQRNGAFPDVVSEIPMYWANMAKRCTIPNCIDVRRAHPLYIWGDDCQYNEQYEKLIVVVMGHCLDPRTFSIECCWPLFCLREVSLVSIANLIVCFPLKILDLLKLLNDFYVIEGHAILMHCEVLSIGFPTLYAFLEPASCLDW